MPPLEAQPSTAPHTDWKVDENGVGWITLTRPKRLNAIDLQMLDELIAHLDIARDDEAVRCVVITGQGRTFSAGGDLSIMKETLGDANAVRDRLRLGLAGVIERIWMLEKPIVAAVNGQAFGAGMNLALACDLVIASREAQFCQAFVKVGLAVDTGGTWALPRLVGLHRAKELAMLGDTVRAEDAHQMGLVNHVVDHADLIPWTTAYATRLAAGATRAIGLTKRAMHRATTATLADALEFEAYAQGIATTTQDHAEGVEAFFAKRDAHFVGR